MLCNKVLRGYGMEKVFTRAATVSGGLMSSYVFEDQKALDHWIATDFVKLEQTYGPLTLRIDTLPGLRIGDTCRVWGEGADTFVIEKLIKYSENRYGFILDSGWSEEVIKCFK